MNSLLPLLLLRLRRRADHLQRHKETGKEASAGPARLPPHLEAIKVSVFLFRTRSGLATRVCKRL